MANLTPEQLDALVAQKASSSEEAAVMKAVLQRESTYGQNPKAYTASKEGIIGPGQIMSKALGAKYGNFETFADAGQTNPNDPVHATNAALNMMKNKWQGAGGNVQKFVNGYFGAGKADKLGGKNSDYVAAISAALAGKAPTTGGAIDTTRDPSSTAATLLAGNNAVQGSAVGAAIGNATIPQSQRGAVGGYNANMIDAATQVANKGKEAINAFDWNPAVAGSSAARFGQAVQGNTNAGTSIDERNAKDWQAFNNPNMNDSYLGRVGSRIKSAVNISGRALEQEFLQRQQAEQSATGTALAKQVGDMAKTNALGVVNPEVYDKAAGNASQQQQVDTGTFNAVTGDANQREQTAAQIRIAEANAASRESIAATKAAAKGTANDPEDNNNLLSAAREMGMNLPGDANTSDMKAVLGPRLQAVQYYLANGRTLGQDPYTALKTVEAMGDMAPPELAAAGAAHRVFIDAIQAKLVSQGLIKLPNAMQQETKEQQAARNAANEAVLRTSVGEYYQKAADGTLNATPGGTMDDINLRKASPYNVATVEQRETLANGVTLAKGISVRELRDPVRAINKGLEAGATTVEISQMFKDLSMASTKGVDKSLTSVFKAPSNSGHFYVKVKASDNRIDLATPAGVEQLKAIEKQNKMETAGIFGLLNQIGSIDSKASDALGLDRNRVN
jgi:hypothetical protein